MIRLYFKINPKDYDAVEASFLWYAARSGIKYEISYNSSNQALASVEDIFFYNIETFTGWLNQRFDQEKVEALVKDLKTPLQSETYNAVLTTSSRIISEQHGVYQEPGLIKISKLSNHIVVWNMNHRLWQLAEVEILRREFDKIQKQKHDEERLKVQQEMMKNFGYSDNEYGVTL